MTWSEVRAAAERLLDATPAARATELAELHARSPELAAEVRELLQQDRDAGRFLERTSALPAADVLALELTPGTRVGKFQLARVLGSGGMGVVWEATQVSPARRVALKILATSSWTRAERRRFEREAQVLASATHPAIARLYDSGVEMRGGRELAWFAMELVEDARDVLTWAEERCADRRTRLALFVELCDAVHDGHVHGVIHRDLKPANVLVDRHGRLKLIDFGVARAGGADTGSLRTRTGEIGGTLQYMAPEQLAGRSSEADARCDVYALGVILYRLLCGTAPFDFAGASLARVARIVETQEPLAPSRAPRAVSGDLEWILLKALEKDRARRYASVAELREDLRRFEAHEPVLARAPSPLARAGKFVRRHRAGVAVGGALALGVALAIGGLVTGLRRARAGEEAAEVAAEDAKQALARAAREAERSGHVLALVESLFEGIDDSVRGRDVRVADLLDAAALAPGAIQDPSVELALRAVRGKIYARLALDEQARAELERALELGAALPLADVDRERLLETRALLGRVRTRLGEPEDGEAMMRAALADAEREGLHGARASVLLALAGYLNEKGGWAELLERAGELAEIAATQPREDLALTASSLRALALQGLGRDAEAVPVLAEIAERRVDRDGERDPRAVTALFNHATALHGAGLADEAEILYPRVLELSREVLGPTHDQTLTVLNNYAVLALGRGDLATSIERLRAAVTAYDERGAPLVHEHLLALNNLGMVLTQSGDFEAAEPWLRRTADASRELLAADDVSGMQMRFNHAACLAWMKRWEEAEPALLAALEELEAALPPDHPVLAKAHRSMADAYLHNGEPEEAARWRGR